MVYNVSMFFLQQYLTVEERYWLPTYFYHSHWTERSQSWLVLCTPGSQPSLCQVKRKAWLSKVVPDTALPDLISVVLLMFKSCLTGHNIIQTVSLPTSNTSTTAPYLPPPSLLPDRGRTAWLLLYVSNCNEIFLTLQSSHWPPYWGLLSSGLAWQTWLPGSDESRDSNRVATCLEILFTFLFKII